MSKQQTSMIVGFVITIFLVGLGLYALTVSGPKINETCRQEGFDHSAALGAGDDFCVDAQGVVHERRRATPP